MKQTRAAGRLWGR